MNLIGEGRAAEVYDYGENKVLKLFRPNVNEAAVTEEYTKSCIVSELLGDFVPKVYERLTYDNRLGIVYEKIEGEDMLKKMMSVNSVSDEYIRQFAKYHVLIQCEMKNQLPSVKERLKYAIERVELLTEAEKENVLAYLFHLPDGKSLCHFDFHPGNIILKNDKPIIIDWITACIGDPCADVARTCMMLKYAEVPGVSKSEYPEVYERKEKMMQTYLTEYLNLTGYKRKDVEAWMLPVMAERLWEWVPKTEKDVVLVEIRKLLAEKKGDNYGFGKDILL